MSNFMKGGFTVEKLLIIACKRMKDDICIACSRCSVAFNRREGEFSRYKDQDVELLGILHCGDCPGGLVGTRLVEFKLWNAPMNEKPTKVHIGPCVMEHCPYSTKIVDTVKEKSGVEVIEGAHPYKPQDVFA